MNSPQNRPKEMVLVVGTGASKIGQSVASSLMEDFEVIRTSKDANDFAKLDILDRGSIKSFIENYLDRLGNKPLKAVFLNSGYMNTGESIDRSNFFERANNGDPQINTHLRNVTLLESLSTAGVVTPDTKVIYNSSVQIFDGKQGYEDYALMKKIVSSLVLNDDRWNATILCLSLVDGTAMTEKFKEQLNIDGKDGFKKFIEQNMPYGQPSLADIDRVVEQILLHKDETSGKFVFIDGGSMSLNKPEIINNDFLFYDKATNSLIAYKDMLLS